VHGRGSNTDDEGSSARCQGKGGGGGEGGGEGGKFRGGMGGSGGGRIDRPSEFISPTVGHDPRAGRLMDDYRD